MSVLLRSQQKYSTEQENKKRKKDKSVAITTATTRTGAYLEGSMGLNSL